MNYSKLIEYLKDNHNLLIELIDCNFDIVLEKEECLYHFPLVVERGQIEHFHVGIVEEESNLKNDYIIEFLITFGNIIEDTINRTILKKIDIRHFEGMTCCSCFEYEYYSEHYLEYGPGKLTRNEFTQLKSQCLKDMANE